MPDDRLQRTRATLPEGYQFGDGRCQHDYRARRWIVPALDANVYIATCAHCGHEAGPVNFSGLQCLEGIGVPIDSRRWIVPGWRPPHENAAERNARYQTTYETGRDSGDEA